MALDFPANPTDGQEYESYVFSASSGVWKSREESAAPAVVSSTPPSSATAGDIWIDSSDGIAYVRYDDGTSSQWIELISSGVPALNLKADKSYVDSQDLLKASLSGASFSGNITSSYAGTGTRIALGNTSAGTDQFLSGITLSNDTGYKVSHFLNSSTRSADGGVNSYTIRNDGGQLNLGSSSYNTNIYGRVTMPQQPVYAGSLNGTGSASNYYPVASDNFVVGFSRSGNNRLTAQVAGKYYIYAQQLVNTSGGVYFHIFKNGSSVVYAYSNSDDTYDVVAAALVDLQVNDYVELYYGNNVSYSWPAPHSSYAVFKVS